MEFSSALIYAGIPDHPPGRCQLAFLQTGLSYFNPFTT
jgi:hypothetical protein